MEQSNLKELADDLSEMVSKLSAKVNSLNRIINTEAFQYISKQARNKTLEDILNDISACEEIANCINKNMKKVKRLHPSEELIDQIFLTQNYSFNTDTTSIESHE